MVVVFCLDDKFVQHLTVSIESLIHYTNDGSSLKIYIIDGGVNPGEKDKLINHFLFKKVRLNFLKINNQMFSEFTVSMHASFANYYRILIPQLLPLEISKAIYFDCDIIFNNAIDELWNYSLNNYAIAASPEPTNIRNIEMGLGNTKTFNSGVLAFNLNKWRRENITKEVLEYIKANPSKIKFWDQDALNAVLVNNWLELPLKWNVSTDYFNRFKKLKFEERQQVKNPYIIHYNTSIKPWHYISRHPYKKLYYKFLKLTPFKNYKPADKTLLNFIKKVISISLLKLNLKKEL